MASYDYGKDYVCAWIRENIPRDAEILDVGACDGKWRNLLPEYQNMDAVEIYEPNASCIEDLYRLVVNEDIYDFHYKWYDLVIFGDVLEHLTVERAQTVLDYAAKHSSRVIIGVPFLYPQGELYGNPFEQHLQPDLTPELFNERYPGYVVLVQPTNGYCYYTNSAEG